MPGTSIMSITIPSNMGSSPGSVLGRVQHFIVTSGSECASRIGQVALSQEPTAVTENRTNNPRAHSARFWRIFPNPQTAGQFYSRPSQASPPSPMRSRVRIPTDLSSGQVMTVLNTAMTTSMV